MNIKSRKSSCPKRTLGSVAVEYLVLIVFIGLSLIAAATTFGNNLNQLFQNIGSYITSSISGTNSGGTLDMNVPPYTNDSSPIFAGTAQPGSTVTIYNGDVVLGEVQVDNSGTWKFVSPVRLEDGTYKISATQTDAQNNTTDLANNYEFTVDTEPPATPMAPGIEGGGSQLPTGAETDDRQPKLSGYGEPGSTITINANGVDIGQTTVDENGAWTFTSEPLNNGAYAFSIYATDRAGNVSGSSAPIDITINKEEP